jgi:transcriptional regulator with XRE-family HTH domain
MPITTLNDADRVVLRRLGYRIAGLRAGRGWSQNQLADVAGLDRTYVSRIEGGRHNITILTLSRLAAALDVTAADLLTGDADASRGLERAVRQLLAALRPDSPAGC